MSLTIKINYNTSIIIDDPNDYEHIVSILGRARIANTSWNSVKKCHLNILSTDPIEFDLKAETATVYRSLEDAEAGPEQDTE